jgi:hypothetical protein
MTICSHRSDAEEPSPDVMPESHTREPAGPGAGYMPAGARAAAAVPQTTPVALASREYQRWAQQASFEGLADVGGLAAPPPALGTTSERRTEAGDGGDEPSRDVVPEPRERRPAGPGVGYLPAGAGAAAPAPQTTPVALGSEEYRRWAQRASFEGLADLGGQAAPPPVSARTQPPPSGTLQPQEGTRGHR